ncbi:MAG: POTRA domain-containing protein [Candidatus Omnitrophota bacterium]
MRTYFLRLAAAVFFMALFCQPVFAQTPPPGSDAGAQAQRYKTDVDAEKKRLEFKKPKAPEITVEEEPAGPAAPEGISFVLKAVNVTGSTMFTPQDFDPIYQSFIGHTVSYVDLNNIISLIKDKYKEDGYLTTTAYLPEQEISGGIVEIRVQEGKMGVLTIENNRWTKDSFIRRFFHSKKNEILNFKTLERDVLRLNKRNDFDVKTVISAGAEPGQSDVVLKVDDQYPNHIGVGADNQGTRLVGKTRNSLLLHSSNLSGYGDTIFLNSTYSSLSFGQSLIYEVPIDTYGSKFGFEYTYYKMRLGKEYKSFDIRGKTFIFTPYLTKELFLTETFEGNAHVGIDIKCIRKTQEEIVTSDDQLRMPYMSFDFSAQDATGYTTFSPQTTFSTQNFMGASSRNHPTTSRPGSGGFFVKYEQNLSRIQKMPWGTYLFLKSDFQIASHTLPSSEQIQFGGANSVRGYPEGDYLADIGGSLNMEWVFPMFLIPKTWTAPGSVSPLRDKIQGVVFVDMGGGHLKKVLPGERPNKFLASVGGGLRLRVVKNFYLRLDWAQRLGDRPTPGSGPSSFHITFQYET